MASRSLDDLHPDLKPLASWFVDTCKEQGIPVLIYMTYRSDEEQDADYAKGRTAPGRIITNAKAGQSKHNFTISGVPAAKAFDCCPTEGGHPVWNGADPRWEHIGEIGESIGLEWGGRWPTLKDRPHFELKE